MKAKHVEKIARNLYLRGGFTQAEIARQVKKSPTQISRWAQAGKWKELRASLTVTPSSIIANTYAQIQFIYDAAEEEDRTVTPKETDQISKLMAGIRQLDKESDLSLYTQVLGEFTQYIRKQDEGLLESLVLYQMDFLTKKAIELTN
jgi:hypothetical protein